MIRALVTFAFVALASLLKFLFANYPLPTSTTFIGLILGGLNPLLAKILFDVLLGSEATAASPERAAELKAAFRATDRESIRRTIRYMHSWQALTDQLPAVSVPTLLMTGDLGDQHWSPADARAAAETMPDARVVTLTGDGHVGPLLVDSDLIAQAVTDFWATIARKGDPSRARWRGCVGRR